MALEVSISLFTHQILNNHLKREYSVITFIIFEISAMTSPLALPKFSCFSSGVHDKKNTSPLPGYFLKIIQVVFETFALLVGLPARQTTVLVK